MLRIDLNLLAGRFHATPWGRHVNEGEPEWPPSPWRLLRALVSSWKRTAPHLTAQELQPLFSKLSTPPSFHLPPAVAGHTRHYMPQANNKKLLVHDPHIKVSRDPDGEYAPVSFVWQSVDLNQKEQALLERLLQGVGYFGRAESWCELTLASQNVDINSHPSEEAREDGETTTAHAVLCPQVDTMLDQLMVETRDLQKQGYNRPPGSRFLTYRRKPTALTPARRSSRPQPVPKQLAVFLIQSKLLPHRRELLRVAQWARMAFNGTYGALHDKETSPCFTGKKDGQARSDRHKHAFFLPYVSEFSQNPNRIDRLYVYAPEGFGPKELAAIKRVRSFRDLRRQSVEHSGRQERFKLTPIELLSEAECPQVFGTSHTWQSWSPFLCNRHPKKNGKDSPEQQLRLECRRRGLPQVKKVEPLADLPGSPRWVDYVSRRWRKKGPKAPPCGFRIHFAEPVTGPLALGGECHFGMGRFLPEN